MTYLGFDVLDQVMHNRSGALNDTYARRFAVLDNQTGPRDSFVHTPAPTPGRPFLWTCFSRTEAAVLRAFIMARRGRAVPFWVPTYQQDLTLASNGLSGATGLSLRWIGYTQHMFAGGGWRRHIALYDPRRQFAFRKITSATDPADFVTESVTLDSALGQDYPAATTIVSFLRLCRLDQDRVEPRWRGHTAEAELMLREVPLEAPV